MAHLVNYMGYRIEQSEWFDGGFNIWFDGEMVGFRFLSVQAARDCIDNHPEALQPHTPAQDQRSWCSTDEYLTWSAGGDTYNMDAPTGEHMTDTDPHNHPDDAPTDGLPF